MYMTCLEYDWILILMGITFRSQKFIIEENLNFLGLNTQKYSHNPLLLGRIQGLKNFQI